MSCRSGDIGGRARLGRPLCPTKNNDNSNIVFFMDSYLAIMSLLGPHHTFSHSISQTASNVDDDVDRHPFQLDLRLIVIYP